MLGPVVAAISGLTLGNLEKFVENSLDLRVSLPASCRDGLLVSIEVVPSSVFDRRRWCRADRTASRRTPT